MIMTASIMFLNLQLKEILIIAVAAILVVLLLVIIINSGKHKRRYQRYYRSVDKIINKKYNGNILVENLINKYSTDNTNTFKSLKRKGKSLTKKYFEYYIKALPELVELKARISPDKNRNQLVVYIINDHDRVLYQWDNTKKLKGLIKSINKYQMLTPMIAFFYELPLNINEANPYRLINHDNDNVLAYEIVKNTKKNAKKLKKADKKALKKKKK
jgi:hypothetical protein